MDSYVLEVSLQVRISLTFCDALKLGRALACVYSLPEGWLHVKDQAVEKFFGSWCLCTAHEVILQVPVPRLNKVIGMNAL